MSDLEKQYQSRLHDPFDWIDMAKKHLISAKLIESRMNEIISINPEIGDDFDFEFQTLMNSCLFLVGIGLENAIKGYMIAKRPNFKDKIELKQYGWDKKYGHGISEMYEINCPEIFFMHKGFLERIQEYLIWIGKYIIPNDSQYLKSDPEYSSNDIRIASQIINEIELMIESEMENKSPSFS